MEPEDFEQRERDKEPVTLRDQFAAAALTGLLAGSYKANTSLTEKAYELADAMLAVRSLKKETPR